MQILIAIDECEKAADAFAAVEKAMELTERPAVYEGLCYWIIRTKDEVSDRRALQQRLIDQGYKSAIVGLP